MPKIKSLLNGEVKNVRGDIAKELVAMGVATIISEDEPDGVVRNLGETPYRLPQPGDFVLPEPEWAVVKHGLHTKPVLAVEMKLLNTVHYYMGRPKDANRKIGWPGCPKDGGRFYNGLGRAIPEDVLRRYAEQWNDNPNLRASFQNERTDQNDSAAAELRKAGGAFRPCSEE